MACTVHGIHVYVIDGRGSHNTLFVLWCIRHVTLHCLLNILICGSRRIMQVRIFCTNLKGALGGRHCSSYAARRLKGNLRRGNDKDLNNNACIVPRSLRMAISTGDFNQLKEYGSATL